MEKPTRHSYWQKMSEKLYDVPFNHNEIHLMLKALDEFVENNFGSFSEKTMVSLYDKLSPLHHEHTRAVRDRIWQLKDVNRKK